MVLIDILGLIDKLPLLTSVTSTMIVWARGTSRETKAIYSIIDAHGTWIISFVCNISQDDFIIVEFRRYYACLLEGSQSIIYLH